MIDTTKKLYIAGHNGMVGSALMRKFRAEGFTNIVTRTFVELDLRRQKEVEEFFEKERPNYVIIAAAKVGGILANNTYRAEFIYDNLMIETNLIHAAYLSGVEKLIFLGSSCIYPKNCPQPIKEEYLLTGPLEETNEPYAIAKIAGIKLCENYYKQYGSNFFSITPTNLYGPNDNFDLNSSHVIPALIRKFHESKLNNTKFVEVWGSGNPKREFLYVEDLTDAIYFILKDIDVNELYKNGISHLNIGTGKDITIFELVELIRKIVGFEGEIVFDSSKPEGTSRKLLDVSRLNQLGWKYKTSLVEGIKKSYEWYQLHRQNIIV